MRGALPGSGYGLYNLNYIFSFSLNCRSAEIVFYEPGYGEVRFHKNQDLEASRSLAFKSQVSTSATAMGPS